MKKIVKILLAFTLILSITLSWSFTTVEAKSNKVSYLMNKKNTYTYGYHWETEKKEERITLKFSKTYYGNDEWEFGDFTKYCQETKKGLFVANGPSTATQPSLKYPIKKNKKWTDSNIGTNYQILEVNKNVKVKAGTFKNVVVVKETIEGRKDFSLIYYAPNVGDIMHKYNEGKAKSKTVKFMELIKVKKG